MKLILKIAAALVGLYLLALGGFFASMFLPPVQFAGVLARIPRFAMPAVTAFFRPFWTVARDGALDVGDPASDLELETYDHKARVRLSSFRGQKPVVLVFGSYT